MEWRQFKSSGERWEKINARMIALRACVARKLLTMASLIPMRRLRSAGGSARIGPS